MFAIATPQTVSLTETPWVDPALPVKPIEPGKAPPAPPVAGTVTFDHPTDDVAHCRMTVTIGDKTFTHTFNVNGEYHTATYEDDKIRKAKEAATKKAEADALTAAKKVEADRLAAEKAKTIGTPMPAPVVAQPADPHAASPSNPMGTHVDPQHGVVNTTETLHPAV